MLDSGPLGRAVCFPFVTRPARAKPEFLCPETMFSSGFFLSGVPNERTLLVGVEVKATSQTLNKGIFTLVLI
jgi:hypothetical protein